MMLSATGLELCSLCPEILSYCPLNSLSTQRPSCPTEKVFSVKRRRDAVVECAHMGGGTAEEPLSRDQKLLLASRASAINGGALPVGIVRTYTTPGPQRQGFHHKPLKDPRVGHLASPCLVSLTRVLGTVLAGINLKQN